ncbi:hypothetical protein VIGAN_04393500 [Vigna angularis var. angularis]|uniref:Uncharacterized protein n=1 Tax=Vigna angularis var. angularis TaxID=157739 RepID=A0A0S3S0D0_PHAAN|nr:hypothetical protein VIGAN_04393500 [Vigna angularis var. angularis]
MHMFVSCFAASGKENYITLSPCLCNFSVTHTALCICCHCQTTIYSKLKTTQSFNSSLHLTLTSHTRFLYHIKRPLFPICL